MALKNNNIKENLKLGTATKKAKGSFSQAK